MITFASTVLTIMCKCTGDILYFHYLSNSFPDSDRSAMNVEADSLNLLFFDL